MSKLFYTPTFRMYDEFPELVWVSIGGESVAYFRERTCHHVKPRTIEDVLGDFAKRVLNSGHQWGLDAEEITAEYAAELRELMGGGE